MFALAARATEAVLNFWHALVLRVLAVLCAPPWLYRCVSLVFVALRYFFRELLPPGKWLAYLREQRQQVARALAPARDWVVLAPVPGLDDALQGSGIDAELLQDLSLAEARFCRCMDGRKTVVERVPRGNRDAVSHVWHALQTAFSRGAERVAVILAPCATVDAFAISQVFAVLSMQATCAVVEGSGPRDGLVLVALTRSAFLRDPFDRFVSQARGAGEITAGQVMAALTASAVHTQRLTEPPLASAPDAGTVEWAHEWSIALKNRQTISVVIPALNEEAALGRTIDAARDVDPADRDLIEVIVVDGGSTDATIEVAERHGATVLRSGCGRALQMNTGALHASGYALLFLHADTKLPARYPEIVRSTLSDSRVAAGAFAFRGDRALPWFWAIEWMTNIRSRFLGCPYGDQAIFLRRDLFEIHGGFPELKFMEDFEMVQMLQRRGTIVTARQPVLISVRRWEKLGVVTTTLINWMIVLAYRMGAEPGALRDIYYGNSLPPLAPDNQDESDGDDQ